MKSSEKKEIFSRSLTELRKNLKDGRLDLNKLILENKQFKLKDNRSIFHKKKEIARVSTAIREKELSAKQAAAK